MLVCQRFHEVSIRQNIGQCFGNNLAACPIIAKPCFLRFLLDQLIDIFAALGERIENCLSE